MGWGWKPYVPVARRQAKARQALQKAQKAGRDLQPVALASSKIARTFWGKAWCDNLEAYSDFANRLPRGRSYVRNGSVIDLKIEPGKVVAQVMGTSLYKIEIAIAPVPATHWGRLVEECTGSIASLVELLQGRLSKPVMERICAARTGLFPAPQEIRLGCSCPDWASMCKHVAAALYGVGARLDEKPELLFVLRQVDANDLLATQAAALPARAKKPAKGRVLDDAALADVFGIELASTAVPADEAVGKPVATRAAKAAAAKSADRPTATRPAAKADHKPAATRPAAKPAKKPAAKAAPAPAAKKKPVAKKAPAPKTAARRSPSR
jgi:uncharacterized Zn finger protein